MKIVSPAHPSLSRQVVYFCFICLMLSISHSYAAVQETDAALEQQLDKLIGFANYPEDKATLSKIIAALNESTPVESYARARGYQVLSMALGDNNTAAALALADSFLNLPRIQSSPAATAELLAVKAEIYLQNNNADKSLELIPAIEQQLETVSSSRTRYYTHTVIGQVLQNNRQFAAALEHFLQAHAAISNTDDANTHRRRQFLNLQIARIQLSLQNFKAALELLDKTIEDSLKHDLQQRLPELYLNRAYAARELNGLSLEIIDTFLLAAKIGKEQGNQRVELAGYNNAGASLLLLKHYDKAEQYLLRARDIATSIHNITDGTVIDFNLGYIQVLRGNHDAGLSEMLSAAEIFRSFAPASQVAQIQALIADAYEVAGRYSLQAQALKEQIRLKDEFFQAERDKVFSELQIRYQAEENALQIKLLEQQTQLQRKELDNRKLTQRLILLAILLMLVIAALLFFAYISSRKVNQLLSKNNEMLQQQSLHDPLTGLLNRRALQNYMPEERRKLTDSHAIFLLDVDHFKHINDVSGHAAGDEILIAVAKRLKALCRSDDLAIRWGGEEFLLVLHHSQAEILPELAKRILHDIGAQPVYIDGNPIRVTLSGGYICLPVKHIAQQSMYWETALKLADHLLYQAKTKGRNQIVGVASLNLDNEQQLLSDQQLLQRLVTDQCTTLTINGPI
ncbi:tetratricopeptide repeat-containing diguanylate cyclase [Rheinheimera pacifica]|uniref:tetratricopeptide repeat-containing diguanylate cyclase n=1 Tax=Rheinheimera pacifica TaxID=173990 RepID=UPI002EDAC872